MFGWFRRRRRNAVMKRAFPESFRESLRKHAPFYARLSERARARLERDVLVFLDEKTFIAAGGLDHRRSRY